MKRRCFWGTLLALVLLSRAGAESGSVRIWLTAPDEGKYLASSGPAVFGTAAGEPDTTVTLDETRTFQTVAGFGASMTEASAWVLDQLTPEERTRAFELLFDRDKGIGISLLRQPLGASDFARSIYSYDDQPEGRTDPLLADFSLDRDREHVLPLLRRAAAVNPELTLIGSPWSPPAWMKTGGSMLGAGGGVLKPEFYGAYAEYFARWIEGYTAQGLKVVAVTPQNEPQYGPKDYPGMVWESEDIGTFVRDHLGPVLKSRTPWVKILGWDHNWDKTAPALTLLGDDSVAPWFAGIAWHHYGGGPEAMSAVRDNHPDKEVWFTEGGSGRWIAGNSWTGKFKAGMVEQVRILKNWSRSMVWWNLVLDQNHGPTVMPNNANDGLLAADTRSGTLSPRPEAGYYALGHLSKFIRPGAVRVGLDADNGDLEAVAFLNPDGSKVVVAANRYSSTLTLRLAAGGQWVDVDLPGDSGATLVW